MSEPERLELEEAAGEFRPKVDKGPKIPEPLPVKLVAVGEVVMEAQTGREKEMEGLYVGLLGFERVPSGEGLVYRAENFNLRFELREGRIERETYRPLQVEVLSLQEAEQKLIDREMAYTRQRGLTPGAESLVLLDPSGNWVEIVEARRIM